MKKTSLTSRSRPKPAVNSSAKQPLRPKVSKRFSNQTSSQIDRKKSTKRQPSEPLIEDNIQEEIIDLSKQEDAEKLAAQLLAFLAIPSDSHVHNFPIARNLDSKSDSLVAKRTAESAGNRVDKFYSRLKRTMRTNEEAKLPDVHTKHQTSQRSLFQVRYSQPTNYELLQTKLDKLRGRPCSFATFDERGESFSRMRSRHFLQSRESGLINNARMYGRSATFPRTTLIRETVGRRSSTKNGRYSVTFKEDMIHKSTRRHDLMI